MTIGELIEKLSKYPSNYIIKVQNSQLLVTSSEIEEDYEPDMNDFMECDPNALC